ncbi:MAG: peroxiredoxin family protein [Anaerolineaceae bacterium]
MTQGAAEVTISIGDHAPDFGLPAVLDGGEQIEVVLSSLIASGPVMLLFYEDDGMPICTSELKAFAQEHELLADAGVQVLGINTNGLGSHAKFHERDHYPFPLVSDFHGETVKAYGMWDADEKKAKRGVVIVGPDGNVQYLLPHFNPGNLVAFEEVFGALGLI